MSNPSSLPEPDSDRPTEPGLGGPGVPLGHIGRYAVKYKISETSTGAVYAAHDPLLSRLIAIKTHNTPQDDAQRSQFKAQFLEQVGAAAGLSHPNIVNIFDVDVTASHAYVAMELLKGKSLAQMRKEGWRPNHSQAALIVRRLADALAYAHSRGVVHGNIKPANIFMLSSTQPRVLDFGLAGLRRTHKDLSPNVDPATPSPSPAQDLTGSPVHHLAPEQIRQQPIDRRTDVFALGVLFYQLLTHQNPFSGATPEEITHSVLEQAPPTAHSLDRNIPQVLSDIAARAMNPDIAHRYRSARAMSRELQQWLARQDKNIEALATFTPAAPRRRSVVWLSILGLSSVVVLSTLAWVSWPTHPDTPPSTSHPSAFKPPTPTAPARSTKLDSALAPRLHDPASSSLLPHTTPPLMPLLTPGLELVGPLMPPTEVTQPRIAIYIPPPIATAATTATATTTATAPSSTKPSTNPAQRNTREAVLQLQGPPYDASKAQHAQHPPQPAALGIVRVAITPWGQIEVDGASVGIAPPLNELTLPEGQHQITIRNGEHPPYTATVKVTPGQPFLIKHRFGS